MGKESMGGICLAYIHIHMKLSLRDMYSEHALQKFKIIFLVLLKSLKVYTILFSPLTLTGQLKV